MSSNCCSCFFQGKPGSEVVGFKLIIQFCMKINQTMRKKWQELILILDCKLNLLIEIRFQKSPIYIPMYRQVYYRWPSKQQSFCFSAGTLLRAEGRVSQVTPPNLLWHFYLTNQTRTMSCCILSVFLSIKESSPSKGERTVTLCNFTGNYEKANQSLTTFVVWME